MLLFPYFPCSFYFVPFSFKANFGGRKLILKEYLFSKCETGKIKEKSFHMMAVL